MLTISYLAGLSLALILHRKEIEWQTPETFLLLAAPLFFCAFGSHHSIGMWILTGFTLQYGQKNRLLLLHWMLILWMGVLCHIAPNLLVCLLVVLCLDMCSVLQVCLLPLNMQGNGPWYYLLYQSLMTILIWWAISLDQNSWLPMFFYWKLGAGIGGYYLPSFYRGLATAGPSILMYIGCSNMLCMWYGFLLFEQPTHFASFYFNVLLLAAILVDWTLYGQWFISPWLYLLSSSSTITAAICLCILASTFLSSISLNLLAAFLFTSQAVWCAIVACCIQ